MEEMKIMQRQEIAENMKWRLEDIYESAEKWEEDFALAQQEMEQMKNLDLRPDKENILAVFEKVFSLSRRIEGIYSYASMTRDQDSREASSQAMADRALTLAIQSETVTAVLRPALLAMPEELLKDCLADERFKEYDRTLEDVMRMRPHILSAAEEQLLAQAGEIGSAPSTIYNLFTEADMTFPTIEGEDGNPVEVSDARIILLLTSRNPRVRRQAYETIMNTYGKYGNMIAATYGASVKYDVFSARVRHFGSAREASLFENEIPVSVYDALQTAVEERIPAMNRYLKLKQKALGLDEMHLWDLYVDTTGEYDVSMSYDEAYDLMCKALAPLGEDYVQVLKKAKDERWIDVMENAGKHSGAYSTGLYGVHPYVLMNFNGNFDSASTLAHEMGHSMHTYYSNENQPYAKANYTLFAAEVASTVNEVLLSCYMLENEKDQQAQEYILGTLLEHFRTTVFRQTLFAAFEKETHAMQERGEPLTRDALCSLYKSINDQYYGGASVVDEPVKNEWMRIPHFYRAFYVYQYATGFSAAVCIARKILSEGESAVKGYKAFLSAGGSLPPIEALKLAGVDMETPQPVREAMDWFEEIVEKLAKMKNC